MIDRDSKGRFIPGHKAIGIRDKQTGRFTTLEKIKERNNKLDRILSVLRQQRDDRLDNIHGE